MYENKIEEISRINIRASIIKNRTINSIKELIDCQHLQGRKVNEGDESLKWTKVQTLSVQDDN